MVAVVNPSATRLELVAKLFGLFEKWPRNEIARQAQCSASVISKICKGEDPLSERFCGKVRGAYGKYLEAQEVEDKAASFEAFDRLVTAIVEKQQADPAMKRKPYHFHSPQR